MQATCYGEWACPSNIELLCRIYSRLIFKLCVSFQAITKSSTCATASSPIGVVCAARISSMSGAMTPLQLVSLIQPFSWEEAIRTLWDNKTYI